MTIEPICKTDVKECVEIYNHYIENTTITLEEKPLTEEEFSARVERITKRYPYFVAKDDGKVTGYAYLDVFNERSAYKITADLSIYVACDRLREGVGEKLYTAIEKAAKECGFENIVSLVTSENDGSVKFHLRNGFKETGELANVARKFDRYVGVKFFIKNIREE